MISMIILIFFFFKFELIQVNIFFVIFDGIFKYYFYEILKLRLLKFAFILIKKYKYKYFCNK